MHIRHIAGHPGDHVEKQKEPIFKLAKEELKKNTAAYYIEHLVRPIREKLLNSKKIKNLREEIQTFEITR